jgi:aryl-alcohol dehydrogenase
MQIRAAVAASNGAMQFQELTLEAPRPNEVLVRVVACGICRLDVTMRTSPRVPKPIVLGHEGAGIVEEIGSSVANLRPGDRVVMSFNSCGHCPTCRAGKPAYCLEVGKYNFGAQRPDGTTALSHGGERVASHFFGQSSFATHAICTERNVVRIPADVPLELMAPLGCGIQTGAGAILRSLKVSSGSSVIVLGAGSVGLSAVMAACIAGAARIVAVDVQPSRLETARELGATHTVLATCDNLTAELLRITGAGANFAVDTSGNIAGIQQTLQALAPFGVMGLISECKGVEIPVRALTLMLGGRSLRGIHQGDSVPQEFIPELVNCYRDGRLPLEKIVTFYEFDQIEQAMADMDAGQCIKPILRMPQA